MTPARLEQVQALLAFWRQSKITVRTTIIRRQEIYYVRGLYVYVKMLKIILLFGSVGT